MSGDSALRQIADLDAHYALAAIVADTRRGARLALEHGVAPDHLAAPALARVFTAATSRDVDEDLAERITAIATTANVDPGWLHELVHAARKCMRDDNGHYARRVIAGAARLDRYRHHVQALADLGIEVAA